MSRDATRRQREDAAEESRFEPEDFAVQQRRDGSRVRPTDDAVEREVMEDLEGLREDLPDDDALFLTEDASPVLSSAAAAQETLEGQEALQDVTDERVDLQSPTDVIGALPTDEDVEVDVGDDATVTFRADDVEAAQEGLEARREQFEADPVEFADELDTGVLEDSARLEQSAEQARARRRATREAGDELREEVAADIDGVEPEDVEIDRDFRAGTVEVADLDADPELDPDTVEETGVDEAREELADELGVDRDDVIQVSDTEVALDPRVEEQMFQERAVEAIDEQVEDREITADDVEFDGLEARLEADETPRPALEQIDAVQRLEDPPDPVEVDFDDVGTGISAADRVDRVGDAREDFREEAAAEFGVAPEDVEIDFDDGEFEARPDTRGSIDTSVGVEALPFAGSSFGFEDLPEPGDQLGFDDIREPLTREAEQLGEAVDRATILPPLDETPGGRAVDAAREFDVEDIPGAGAMIGADDVAALSVEDIPGAGAQIGEDEITRELSALDDAASAELDAITPDVDDIPGAGAQIGEDEISAELDGVTARIDEEADVDRIPGAGEQFGFEDIPERGDLAGGDFGRAEQAAAVGAAGVATPEPGTTAGGLALLTAAGGALAVDAARRSEVEVPEPGEMIGSGITVGSEVDTPTEPTETLTTELDIGEADFDAPEVATPTEAEPVESELDVGEPLTDTGEIGVPSVEAQQVAVGRERLVDEEMIEDDRQVTIGREGLEGFDEFGELPEDERLGQIRDQLERQQEFVREDTEFDELRDEGGVTFPAEQASDVTEAVEFDATEFDAVEAAELAEAAAPSPRAETVPFGEPLEDDVEAFDAGTVDRATREVTDAAETAVEAEPFAEPAADTATVTEPLAAADTGVEAAPFEAADTVDPSAVEASTVDPLGQQAGSAGGPTGTSRPPSRPPEFDTGFEPEPFDQDVEVLDDQFVAELDDPDFLGGEFDVDPVEFDDF